MKGGDPPVLQKVENATAKQNVMVPVVDVRSGRGDTLGVLDVKAVWRSGFDSGNSEDVPYLASTPGSLWSAPPPLIWTVWNF